MVWLLCAAAAADTRSLDDFEARLVQDPANLRLAAEFRQLIIESGHYDRSITLFERLAKDRRGGANRFINLALAHVDTVPVSGSVRRALLGREALNALTSLYPDVAHASFKAVP